MAKRGYKLQEFLAHSSNVKCLRIGKRSCRLFLTGGDDYKVNLWSIGKPNSLMSLCGHISPVESVAFDASEVLVLGGAASGVIKLWDLEEAKMVRGLTGHRSNCTTVEFHPFGEFFASGSTDTNLKVWDIREKGCIHTYKGHTKGVSTIKFTPDGRWVVSGGYDNVVKVWDLTAGKLLHDFKFHENHIRSIDFHPLEFLMATGSADKTVKYWDLETFELIGSSRPEGSGVRAIAFNPDGRTLFCGFDDNLKVYSWEPVICHDTVDMGWSSLGELCIHEGKIVGCSHYRNSVSVWAADTSLIKPFAKGRTDQQVNLPASHSPAKVENSVRLSSSVRCPSPDYETKDIKNIYVDTSGGKPTLQRASSLNSSKVLLPLDLKDRKNLTTQSPRQSSVTASPEKLNGRSNFVVPVTVTPDSSDGREAPQSRKDSITLSKTKPGMLLRPGHTRRPSLTKYSSIERLSVPSESPDIISSNRVASCHLEPNSGCRDASDSENVVMESSEGMLPDIKTLTRTTSPAEIPKPEKASLVNPEHVVRVSSEENVPSLENISEKLESAKITKVEKGDECVAQSRENKSMKIVRGVAVMTGRTRTLVEKFEKRERLNIVEEQGAITLAPVTPTMDCSLACRVDAVDRKENSSSNTSHEVSIPSVMATTLDRTPVTAAPLAENLNRRDGFTAHTVVGNSPSSQFDATDRKENSSRSQSDGISTPSPMSTTSNGTPVAAAPLAESFKRRVQSCVNVQPIVLAPDVPCVRHRTPVAAKPLAESIKRRDRSSNSGQPIVVAPDVPHVMPTDYEVIVMEEQEPECTGYRQNATVESIPGNEPQISGSMEFDCENHTDVIEVLMQSHEVFLTTLRSRLTKLQVVRHFWERKDMKGAINALKRLPDHSVQAHVIGVLTEKMEILNLDLFSLLLPVLVGLLDSKTERHAILSMEMLMKLVAVFGPVVRSTISARPSVGVDLHAEERLECCNQCWLQMQKIQKILPLLVRCGGLLAKAAHELNLILQQV
ncbi:hypothetical protein MLD38_036989 [Melastoma candidum]|uniref:Uncharacterized protein n=1 Tax=Melastoma candidum TaxID=119954 RepID=A0ACB9LLC6_9MYRT|nr:hypothetical protein MLD38_036989 [Melastoma candidum]